MNSLAFPDMLSSVNTNIIYDHKATVNNLKLLLMSMKKELFGDPYFGTNLKTLTFEQNSVVLADLLIDEIYTAIQDFMPQLYVKRDGITINAKRDILYINIKGVNLIDYQLNTYNIEIMNDGE